MSQRQNVCMTHHWLCCHHQTQFVCSPSAGVQTDLYLPGLNTGKDIVKLISPRAFMVADEDKHSSGGNIISGVSEFLSDKFVY